MASQVNDVFDNVNDFKLFKCEMLKLFHSILDIQNAMKQELFLLRTNQNKSESKNKSEQITSETYAQKAKVSNKSPSRNTHLNLSD